MDERVCMNRSVSCYDLRTTKERLWLPLITHQIVYLGYAINNSSVKKILIENGYDPEPALTVRSTWHEFIKSHWDVLAACDLFTVELLVGHKLVRCTVFFVIELATRKVFYAPIKLQPDGAYMKQVAKLLVDSEDGFLQGKRYLIHDQGVRI